MSDTDEYEDYFGYTDAAVTARENILQEHLGRAVELSLKWGDRRSGRCIVVGIKGSGKTDLRRFIEETDRAKSLVLNLNTKTGYFKLDAGQVNLKSGRIMNSLALLLLGTFAQVIPSTGSKAKRTVEGLREAAGVVAEVAKRIGQATTVDLKFAQIDLSKLSAAPHSGFVQETWEKLVSDVKSALANKRGYILIDDLEDVFPGIELNAHFMEGLARAVYEINQSFGAKLHALLFVKYGTWRYWFEHPWEYDRVKHVIVMMSWDSPALIDLIAKRIAYRKSLSDAQSAPELWSSIFEFDDFSSFSAQFTDMCVNGPRDMIELCNRCSLCARNARITSGHLQRVLPGYSEEKLRIIHADFGDVYPDVENLAIQVLRNSSKCMKVSDLSSRFEDKIVKSSKIWQDFQDHVWFKTRGPDDFPALMYDVGIVGVQEGMNVTYAIEVPKRTLRLSDLLVIHPAFRPYLAVS